MPMFVGKPFQVRMIDSEPCSDVATAGKRRKRKVRERWQRRGHPRLRNVPVANLSVMQLCGLADERRKGIKPTVRGLGELKEDLACEASQPAGAATKRVPTAGNEFVNFPRSVEKRCCKATA
jgi:hypothetical protein